MTHSEHTETFKKIQVIKKKMAAITGTKWEREHNETYKELKRQKEELSKLLK